MPLVLGKMWFMYETFDPFFWSNEKYSILRPNTGHSSKFWGPTSL
jgi:hypothetical protein